MTAWAQVGISELPGRTFGKPQYIDARYAPQLLALIEWIATLPGCRRLTVNEGRRSRADQDLVWAEWLRDRRVLAAPPYTSRHDEVNHGTAADLGGPGGDVLNDAEIAALETYGPDFGVEFTGLGFIPREPWHVEVTRLIDAYPSYYLDLIVKADEEDDSMKILNIDGTKVALDTGTIRHLDSQKIVDQLKRVGIKEYPVNLAQAKLILLGHMVPQEMAEIKKLTANRGVWSIDERARAAAVDALEASRK